MKKITTGFLSFAVVAGVLLFIPSAEAAMTPAGMAFSAAGLNAAPEPQAKQPQWKSNEEYQAFQAMASEKDANKRIALAQAFLEKFKDSDFTYGAYMAMMQSYIQLGDSAKAVDSARKALQSNPDNLDALAYVSFTFPYTFNSKDPDAATALSRADSDARHGLEVLQKIQKPQNFTDEQFRDAVKPKRAIFNTVVGFVALQRKDSAAALTSLKAAEEDNPSDNLVFSLLGQAYLYSKPADFDNAIWYLARSVSLAQAAKSDNLDQLQKFYDQVYVNRHGSDVGEKDLVAQAATSADPPAGFKVAPAPKHAATGNQSLDAFYTIEDSLTVGGAQADANWQSYKGQPFGIGGQVDSVEKGTEPNTYLVRIDVTPESKAKDGVYDIELKESQADAKYLEKGDLIRFQGVLSAFTLTPSFVLTLDNGNINADDLAAAVEKAKNKPKPKPTTKPKPKPKTTTTHKKTTTHQPTQQ